MTQTGWLILAICVLALLVGIFIGSFILFMKTPVPAGCEKKPSALCEGCANKRCEFYLYEPKGKFKEINKESDKEEEKK